MSDNAKVLSPADVKRNRATRQFTECQVRKALDLNSVAEVRKPVWSSESGVKGNALTAAQDEAQGD